MKHFAIHKLSKTQPSLLSKVSDRLCCGDMDSAVYFYHSDHLGSASWITNGNGTPIQHLQYMPYGEPFVNERTSSYEERFTFTGKERDSETGFSYFGARYYDSDILTSWLSVDPMADKYPNISPYAYCAWNPIRLVDPDGREIVFEDNKVKVLFEQVYNNVKNRISKLENSGLKKKRDIREYEQLKEIYASLNDVKESSIVFYYKTIKNDGNTLAEGHTYGKKNVDGIIVEILEGSENTLIHETRHASGYINEEWDLNKNVIDSYGVYTPTNYDYQDEYEGYNQAYIYSRIFHNELYKSDNQIKNEVIHFNCYKDYIIKEFVQYSKSNPYKK